MEDEDFNKQNPYASPREPTPSTVTKPVKKRVRASCWWFVAGHATSDALLTVLGCWLAFSSPHDLADQFVGMLVGVLALQIAFGVGLVTAAFWRMFRTRLFATHWPGRVARFFAGFSLLCVFLFIEAGFQMADTPPDQKGILWAAYTIVALMLGALISVEIEVKLSGSAAKTT